MTARDEAVPAGGMSIAAFARRCGITEATILRYARNGRIFGARKHPLTKKWWVFPDAPRR